MKKRSKNKVVRLLSNNRFYILIVLGAFTYLLVSQYQVSLWWVLAFGTLTGIVFGKVFCRWMCPIGIIMELMMKFNKEESLAHMYQYHKIGCPIAWISGLLNRMSFFRIKVNAQTCTSCGLCDKSCYMPSLESEKFSLYQAGKTNPGNNYSCSKCLACVAQCPNGSLSYKPFYK